MAEETLPTTPSISFVNGKTSTRSNTLPYTPRRASALADASNSLRKRRGSTLSDSLDEARMSIRSSTDDLLLPRPKHADLILSSEHSHWHSAPLVLALLPALGGLFFHNGSAVVTDLTLLGLAAILLHWSVSFPWRWYHSSQSTQSSSYSISPEDSSNDPTSHEEGSQDEHEHEKPNQTHEDEKNQASRSKFDTSPSQSWAASELRFHELVALLTCFVSPIIGAWLLHTIRSRLSRPSEGLVSNYNLAVFLLAAELRPLAHLAKLVQARTLYLQRSLNPSPINPALSLDPQRFQDLSARLDDIEAHIAAAVPSSAHKPSSSNPPISAQIITEVRKSLQPDLDALNRAVRRYEKRATLLSMQTESRLQDLESRMADAITLAAAAERSNSHKFKRGSALILLDWVCAAIVLPLQTIQICINLPLKVARSTYMAVEGYIIRKVRKRARIMGRGEDGAGPGAVENGNYERKTTGMGNKGRGMKKAS